MKRRQAKNNQGTGNALIRAFPVFVLLKYPFTYGIITSAGKSAKADFKHALARLLLFCITAKARRHDLWYNLLSHTVFEHKTNGEKDW